MNIILLVDLTNSAQTYTGLNLPLRTVIRVLERLLMGPRQALLMGPRQALLIGTRVGALYRLIVSGACCFWTCTRPGTAVRADPGR